MTTQPKLEQRSEQPYVAIRQQVTKQELGTVLPPLISEVLAWLGKKGVAPAGAPFWRYLIVDMDKKLEVDVGVPVATALPGGNQVIADVLPAGRYATVLHTGHHDELQQVTADLLAWAEAKGIWWQMDGERWCGRVEWYFTDPETEPDMNKWQTELAFLTTEARTMRD